jgi:transketolase
MTPYETAIQKLVEDDPSIIIMTAENRAPMRSLIPLLKDNFVDVGIAEQTMIGMAAGLALGGRRPIVHALAAFLTMRSFEFIRTDVGIPGLPVIMMGFVPGFLSDGNGPTHQAIEDVGLMRMIPNVNVFVPADQEELAGALPELIRSESPWYVRFPALIRGHAPQAGETIFPGEPTQIQDGAGVCILSYGMLLEEVRRAGRILRSEGIEPAIVNVHTLKPLPAGSLKPFFERYRMIVTVEDHFQLGGLTSIVRECMGDYAREAHEPGRPIPAHLAISLEERFFRPAMLEEVLSIEGFSGEAIAEKILQASKTESETYAK